MKKFQNKYRITSARLRNWNYASNGVYFITICTKYRKHHFGSISEGKMKLNEIGEMAWRCWMALPRHFEYLFLDEFVVMPNHIHGILIIDKPNGYNHWLKFDDSGNGVKNKNTDPDTDNVETGHALSLHALSLQQSPNSENNSQKTNHPRYRNQGKNSISAMVGSFKSAVTKSARPKYPGFGWQIRFHDHIIRTYNDFLRIAHYIRNNPGNWYNDSFNQ